VDVAARAPHNRPVTTKALSTVLLVDDEADIRRIGELGLRAVGKLDVRLAASGAEAIAEIERARPDVVLLDVMMPELDGPETLARIRALPDGASLPVIFVTAKIHPGEVEHYRALGAIGVVAKPFDPITLPQTIRSLVAAAH
jgi:CheY-like chemotaxis protein